MVSSCPCPERLDQVAEPSRIRDPSVRTENECHAFVRNPGSADQALALTASGSPVIDLLLTDVLMPGMSGVELAQKLRERFPGLPVVFMSGFATELLAKQGLRPEAGGFVAKPFGTEALGKAVREALDARAPQQPRM